MCILIVSYCISNAVEIQKEIEAAVTLLSQSVGIRINPAQVADFTLDGGHVSALLQTPKGKRLMSRCL